MHAKAVFVMAVMLLAGPSTAFFHCPKKAPGDPQTGACCKKVQYWWQHNELGWAGKDCWMKEPLDVEVEGQDVYGTCPWRYVEACCAKRNFKGRYKANVWCLPDGYRRGSPWPTNIPKPKTGH